MSEGDLDINHTDDERPLRSLETLSVSSRGSSLDESSDSLNHSVCWSFDRRNIFRFLASTIEKFVFVLFGPEMVFSPGIGTTFMR